ncbi:isocitrate lyase/phosphoenolpyruvate mutase family protein [Jatrophihabitans telluris]|uniref:Isocitrate lyase/phosphoenolpyruvate mutase family protein n=1 Tax=Jatrophihabitans telluris TaxID=2038343 RepID=A0ABY4QYP0_9ACTN|nr:isocitrate lyase/phosphoenolpyruvate mutase family protein [Jatrophihabitans telluris]UQX88766.1 isocitrate lyase/phosphoenolpyruvate mutase family protein [Jatrophihabitans telluris]
MISFRELHVPGTPLILGNAWDLGSARLLASLGYRAVATTSSGFAATLGRHDGQVSKDEALAHAGQLARGVRVPVSADLENGFADDPAGVAATVAEAAAVGLAGCSIEDYSAALGIYPTAAAVDRVAAAAEAARACGRDFVLTARAENLIRDNPDLADTIARLQAYQDAGADVLFAPGLRTLADVRVVVAAVDRPVNVLLVPGAPTVSELADAGVARVSVGGGFSKVGLAAVASAASELLEHGTADWQQLAERANPLIDTVFRG